MDSRAWQATVPWGHKELDTAEHAGARVRAHTHANTLEYPLRARNLHSELLPLIPYLLQQTMMQKSTGMDGGKAVDKKIIGSVKRKTFAALLVLLCCVFLAQETEERARRVQTYPVRPT